MTTVDRSTERHLLIPDIPTPNGPLHLGHIGGPYLRTDILARSLRRAGARVAVASGVDSYESHVLPTALRTHEDPGAVARRYYTEISNGLAALGIEPDVFIDPLDPQWNATYVAAHLQLLDELRGTGAVVEVTERFPYSPARQLWIAGSLLEGTCPVCGVGAGGYNCESCSYQFRPEELVDPRPRIPVEDLEWRPVRSLFLSVKSASELIDHPALPDKHRSAVRRFLDRQDGRIRLTNPAGWGVPVPGHAPQVIFTYGATGYMSMLGELVRDTLALDVGAFTASNVRITGLFGVDNIVPWAVNMQGVFCAAPSRRPLDRFVICPFMLLTGQKFSTSRGHVIPSIGAAEVLDIQAELLRYYLALLGSLEREESFEPADLITIANAHVCEPLTAALDRLDRLDRAGAGAPRSPTAGSLLERAAQLTAVQLAHLESDPMDLPAAALTVRDWIAAARDVADHELGAWLDALGQLAEPFFPRFAAAVADSSRPDRAAWLRRWTRPLEPVVASKLR